jgi:glycosyltransferase involved in cell wall biosynthesis
MSRRRFRVLHLITRLDLGGAQQNTLFCVTRHDRERFEVELIAGEGGLLDAEARSIPEAHVALVPWLRHRLTPLVDLTAVLRLRDLLRRRRIDLLHTHSSKAGIVGRWAAALAGVPRVVHTVHGWSFNATQPAWARRACVALERAAASVTDKLIVVSERSRRQGLEAGIGRERQYELVHSGIDVEHYRSGGERGADVRGALGFGPEHVVVGTVSCLKPQKAPLDFVRAAAAAHARNDQLRFFIAGDGELRADVERLVQELGLVGVLHLLGWRRDVPELLRAMDVFLLTSRFEGLPRAVLQAMAAGVPVIATDVDGIPEVVEHRRTGLLVPAGRPDLAAQGLVELALDRRLRAEYARRGRARLDSRFDIQSMVRRLDGLYLSLLEGTS